MAGKSKKDMHCIKGLNRDSHCFEKCIDTADRVGFWAEMAGYHFPV